MPTGSEACRPGLARSTRSPREPPRYTGHRRERGLSMIRISSGVSPGCCPSFCGSTSFGIATAPSARAALRLVANIRKATEGAWAYGKRRYRSGEALFENGSIRATLDLWCALLLAPSHHRALVATTRKSSKSRRFRVLATTLTEPTNKSETAPDPYRIPAPFCVGVPPVCPAWPRRIIAAMSPRTSISKPCLGSGYRMIGIAPPSWTP
jgi:hypothetical protein